MMPRRVALGTSVVVAALVAAGSVAAAPPLRVVGIERIGSLSIAGSPPAARRAFGTPTTKRAEEAGGLCDYTWPGLEIVFYNPRYNRQCRDDTVFASARITRDWVTDRGLRRGDTVARAKALYPVATKKTPFLGTVDLIVRTSPVVGDYGLSAEVRNGRVTALILVNPQDGF
jgi:hypothetical protein